MQKRRIPSHLPAVLSLGFTCQVTQIVLMREFLMVFHGNEFSLGIILAVWMLWVGFGSRLGAAVAERMGRPVFLVAVNSALLVPSLLLTVLLIRLLRGFFSLPAGAYLSVVDMAVSCLAVSAPVCLLLGAQFVFLARLWRESDGAPDTDSAGKTYIGEAAGHIAGGILFSLVLVHLMDSFQVLLIAGFLMLLSAAWMSGRPPLFRGRTAVTVFAAAILFALLPGLDSLAFKLQWRTFAPEFRLIGTRQSRYGTVAAAERGDQYSFFQSGHLVFSAAGPGARETLEEQDALVFAHFSLTQHEDPRRILLIGGGLRGTLREMLLHPVDMIDYIELDPVLGETAEPFLIPSTREALESPRVRRLFGDGRLFLRSAKEKYDMIVADVPDPATTVLNRYYTVEFFRRVRDRLRPGGVFVTALRSSADLRGAAAANRNSAIYHSLRRVFPRVLPAGEGTLFFFASADGGGVSADPGILRDRFRSRNIRTEGFPEEMFELLLEEGRLRRTGWVIRNHGRAPGAHLEPPRAVPLFPASVEEQEREEGVLPPAEERFFINSDFRPVGAYHTLVFWNALSRRTGADFFSWIARVEPWWMAPPAGLALLAAIILRVTSGARRDRGRRFGRRYAVLCAVFTTGLSTLALQVALLLIFQSLYGFVYEMAGIVVAVFMLGLALGTSATHFFADDKTGWAILAAVQLAITFYAGALAWGLPLIAKIEFPGLLPVLVTVMTFFAGVLNGADFPLAAGRLQALTGRAERAAGTVYGVELFGASAGALLAGMMIAPVLGIAAVCVFAAAANGTAFAVLLITGGGSHA